MLSQICIFYFVAVRALIILKVTTVKEQKLVPPQIQIKNQLKSLTVGIITSGTLNVGILKPSHELP